MLTELPVRHTTILRVIFPTATHFNTEAFKRVALEMVTGAGCDILFHVFSTDTIVEQGVVQVVILETKMGRAAVQGKVVIDATGGGGRSVSSRSVLLADAP